MPAALTLHLRTIRAWNPDTRQLHGLACALFEGDDADHTAQQKLFTVQQPTAQSPTALRLRATWYGARAVPGTALEPRLLRLGNTRCQVIRTELRTESFAALAAAGPTTRATLTFRSPTYFQRSGEPDLTPDPALILGSHRRSWNTGVGPDSPLHIDDTAWQDLQGALRIDHLNLTTTTRDSGYDRLRTGFTGTITLRLARTTPPHTAHLLATLTRFAPYAGTGAGTTHGFGATTSVMVGERSDTARHGPQRGSAPPPAPQDEDHACNRTTDTSPSVTPSRAAHQSSSTPRPTRK
ncbi:CRISPR system precrRNA processing endoribonuclease RAMP protein Cas6 [Streptomyces triticisoli]|uniref:CRISPR system precrRNA processing endoribonuclease RAMP protein Cas6 n=1 Tax=Streptomyces triticisoli TaxID=2182797 RepID=UPI001300396D|nr:CRISPR system precrRNA processing endoribonuclease RAMP protein Cas6 [Streptomyces triticisoli]